jgi:hypothetical protein
MGQSGYVVVVVVLTSCSLSSSSLHLPLLAWSSLDPRRDHCGQRERGREGEERERERFSPILQALRYSGQIQVKFRLLSKTIHRTLSEIINPTHTCACFLKRKCRG